MTTSGNRTAEDPKSGSKGGVPQKPSEVAHERPTDDPGRGQGDVFDDKLPPESNTESNAKNT